MRNVRGRSHVELLLGPENRVLCDLGDSEFERGFSWNLDLLLRLGIKAGADLPLLFDQLAKAGQDEFAVLFSLLVREGTPAYREILQLSFYRSVSLRRVRFEVLLLSWLAVPYGSDSDRFQLILTSQTKCARGLEPPSCLLHAARLSRGQ